MSYIRNPRCPFMWESDGDFDGKYKARDGSIHDTPEQADKRDKILALRDAQPSTPEPKP